MVDPATPTGKSVPVRFQSDNYEIRVATNLNGFDLVVSTQGVTTAVKISRDAATWLTWALNPQGDRS